MGAYGSPELNPKTRVDKCPMCGNMNNNDGNYCTACGYSFYSQNFNAYSNLCNNQQENLNYRFKNAGTVIWAPGKLVLSIISFVLFTVMILMSITIMVSTDIKGDELTPGFTAFTSAGLMLAAAIVSISTRHSRSRAGSIVATALYFTCALLTIDEVNVSYGLATFGSMAFSFGLVNLGSACLPKKGSRNRVINKVLVPVIVLISVFAFFASCYLIDSDTKKSLAKNTDNAIAGDDVITDDNDDVFSLGETFVFDNLEITLRKEITYTTLDNFPSENNGKKVIRVPVTVKNIGEENNSLNMFYYKLFGPSGVELEQLSFYFDDSVDTAGELLCNAKYTKYIYFLYDGSGKYTAIFKKSFEEKRVEFTAK